MSAHGSDKNIALAPDLLAEVEKLASSEHRTTDEIMNEAARKYLDVQHAIAEMDSFVARKPSRRAGPSEAYPRSLRSIAKKNAVCSCGPLHQTQIYTSAHCCGVESRSNCCKWPSPAKFACSFRTRSWMRCWKFWR
jgi:predicted transcriptional regulator